MSTTLLALVAIPSSALAEDDGDDISGIVSSQPIDTNKYARTPVAGDYGVSHGTLGGGAFVRDTSTTAGGNETSIAVNPENPNQIIVSSFNGCFTCNAGGTDVQYSSDGGNTWTDENVIPAPPGASNVGPRDQTFDYGRNGVLYGTILVGPNTNLQVYTGSTTDPTSTTAWQWYSTGNPPVAQATNSNGTGQVDQPWLLVNSDPTTPAQDDVYVAYDDDSGTAADRVSVARGSAPPNFVADVQAGTSSGAGSYNQGFRLAIDPLSGDTYALFQQGNGAGGGSSSNIKYVLNRTSDGGATWTLNGNSGGIEVARGDSTQVSPKFGTVNSLRGGVDHAAVDPNNGDVYVVYGNRDSVTGKERLSIVRMHYDSTGNLVKASPFDTTTGFVTGQVDAALPSVAVAGNGVVGVMYTTFDGFSSVGFPIFSTHLAESGDHGVTFSDQVLETFLSPATDPGPSVDTKQNQRVLGDYQQLKAVGNYFYGAFPGNGAPFGAASSIINPIFVKAFAGGPQVAVTSNLDFGTVARGSTATTPVTLQNTGTDPLVVNGFSLRSDSDPAFSVPLSPGTPRTIQPGGSLVYQVQFSPPSNSTAAERDGTLVIETNDPGNPTITAEVKGDPGVPKALASPAALSFGTVPAGSSVDLPLTVQNNGAAPLTVSSVSFPAGDFSVLSTPATPTTIPVGSSAVFTTRFTAPPGSTGGPESANVTITTDDPAAASITRPATANVGVAQITVSPGALSFGTVPRGTSAALPVTITNTGQAPLVVSGVTLTGDPEYSVVSGPGTPQTVPVGASVSYSLKFAPPAGSSGGDRTANLSIASNDPNRPTATVALSGTVGVPVAVPSPRSSILFADTCAGSHNQQELSITNSGYADLTVSAVTITGPDASQFSVDNAPPPAVVIRPGSYFDFILQFNPTSGGTKNATVNVVTDDPVNGTISVPLTGGGEVASLVLGTSTLAYGGIPVDDRTSPHTGQHTLVLSNQSDCPLTINSLTFGGVNPGDFALIGAPSVPFTVGAHNEVDLTVEFNPAGAGSRAATLTIGSSDPIHPSQTATLVGSGLLPGITTDVNGTLVFPPTVVEPVAGGTGGVTQNVKVTNSGQAELIVDTLAVSGSGYSGPGATSPPQRFAVNQSFTEPVTFHPSGSPSRKVTGALTISDNVSPLVSKTVPLCGEAVGRGIRVLVVDRNGNLYNGLTKGKLQSNGLHDNVNINLKATTLTTIDPPTTCQRVQYDYENQDLPAAYTVNQRQAYYVLSVFEGNQQTNFTFTLMPNEFKLIVLTI